MQVADERGRTTSVRTSVRMRRIRTPCRTLYSSISQEETLSFLFPLQRPLSPYMNSLPSDDPKPCIYPPKCPDACSPRSLQCALFHACSSLTDRAARAPAAGDAMRSCLGDMEGRESDPTLPFFFFLDDPSRIPAAFGCFATESRLIARVISRRACTCRDAFLDSTL